jgi:serine protease Do
MPTPEAPVRQGRETHLLLVTIAISVGVLLLLARFRFPDQVESQPVESAAAPLERLAARATFDELASAMADLERRIAPRVAILRTQSPDGSGSLVVAPRLLPDRAVSIFGPDEELVGAASGREVELMTSDASLGVVTLRVPAMDDSAVSIRLGTPRTGPRYIALLEATAQGPVLRPMYVGRADVFQDPRTGVQLFSLGGLQQEAARGAALFTLDGAFIGLVRDGGFSPVAVPAEYLRSAAQNAQPEAGGSRGQLGLEVDSLSAAVARATGAERGVVVAHVAPNGPAAGVLHPGDVVQSIDGTAVSSAAAFEELERSRTPAAEVTISGTRRRSPFKLTIRAADRTAPRKPADSNGAGFTGLSIPGAGVEVIGVTRGGAAAAAGLRPGDLIVAVETETAPEASLVDRRFRSAGSGTALLITIQRGGRHRVLALEKR